MSFLIKDDEVLEKNDKIWDVIENKLGIKFHSKSIYDYIYLKAKVREFDGVIKTTLCVMINTCIACITIE